MNVLDIVLLMKIVSLQEGINFTIEEVDPQDEYSYTHAEFSRAEALLAMASEPGSYHPGLLPPRPQVVSI